MKEQKMLFESGNELAAYAAKQINYHVMGYYPITPSTQIAEYLDQMKADGEHDISLIAAEGEHSAAVMGRGPGAAECSMPPVPMVGCRPLNNCRYSQEPVCRW